MWLARVAILVVWFLHNTIADEEITCPGWLDEYKKFHDTYRNDPNAKYLVYYCDHGCEGTCDRMRAMMLLLRIAYAYKKVLLLHWSQPHALENYLLPAAVNWTATSVDLGALAGVPSWREKEKKFVGLLNGDKESVAEFDAQKYIRIMIGAYYNTKFANDPYPIEEIDPLDSWQNKTIELTYIQQGTCLYRFLFKFHPRIEKKVDDVLIQHYGSKDAKYIAWHYRGGGMVGEVTFHRFYYGLSRLAIVMIGRRCAFDMAQERGINVTQYPVVFMTDNNPLRTWAASGAISGVFATDVKVQHIQNTHTDIESYDPVFVDLLLLGRADCAIHARSGISFSSGWIRPRTCFKRLEVCVDQYKAEVLQGVEVRH